MAKTRDDGATAVLERSQPAVLERSQPAKPAGSDAEVMSASETKPRTDADVLSSCDRPLVQVQAGDYIVHVTSAKIGIGATCWFKAPEGASTRLNKDRNVLGIALEPFSYWSGEGRSCEDVRYREVRRWLEPFRGPPYRDENGKMQPGIMMPGGDMATFNDSTGSVPGNVAGTLANAPPAGPLVSSRKGDALPAHALRPTVGLQH